LVFGSPLFIPFGLGVVTIIIYNHFSYLFRKKKEKKERCSLSLGTKEKIE
jgi:hypothetical protein